VVYPILTTWLTQQHNTRGIVRWRRYRGSYATGRGWSRSAISSRWTRWARRKVRRGASWSALKRPLEQEVEHAEGDVGAHLLILSALQKVPRGARRKVSGGVAAW